MHKIAFDTFALNDNKYQINLDSYFICKSETQLDEEAEEKSAELPPQEISVSVREPRICTWEYLTKNEVKTILEHTNKSQVRKFIETKLKKKPKGLTRIVFRELIYTVTKLCKRSNFNLEQSGALLSEFYLTHLFFTSSLDVGPEKVYDYFKSLQLCHSLPFPPNNVKLFNLEEAKLIMTFFSKVYLKNLPVIRFLSLPNFTLQTNYHLLPEMSFKKEKKKESKKKKKK